MSTTPAEAVTPAAPEAPAEPAAEETPQNGATPNEELGEAGKAALEREREARKAEEKARKSLQKEYDALKQTSMTDAEKAVEEAKAAGRSEAASEYGSRLARAKFDAAAGRRNPTLKPAEIDEYVQYTNMQMFVDDGGEVDESGIQKAVERLIPEAPSGPTKTPSFDSGTRPDPPKNADMNATLRAGFGRG